MYIVGKEFGIQTLLINRRYEFLFKSEISNNRKNDIILLVNVIYPVSF